MCYDTKLIATLTRNASRRKQEKSLCSEEFARSTLETASCDVNRII